MAGTGAAGRLSGRREGAITRNRLSPGWAKVKSAVLGAIVLAIACLFTYVLVTRVLSRLYSTSKDSDVLGGMWAVIATIFVIRDGYRQSVAAAASRVAATLASFLVCLIYLLFLPFHSWALAVLIGASALVVTRLGRPEDAITAAVTTTVVMVVAALNPQRAWQQPVLRLADTVVGVVVGIAAVWVSQRAVPSWIASAGRPGPAPAGHGRSL
jgi:hypothetical protein